MRILRWILYVMAGIGWIAILSIALSSRELGGMELIAPYLAAWVVLLVLAFARHLSFRLRLTGTLVMLVVAGTYSLTMFGLSNGRPLLLATVVLGSALVGVRAGAVVAVGDLVAIAIAGTLRLTDTVGTETVAIDTTMSWFRAGMSFTLLSGVCVAAVGLLTRELQRQLDAANELLADLRVQVGATEAARGAYEQTAEELRRRNAVLQAASIVATRLLEADRWEDIAPDIVRELGIGTGVPRCQIAQFRGDGDARTFRSRFMWAAEGVHRWADREDLQDISPAAIGLLPFVAALDAGEPFAFDASKLPDGPRRFAQELHMASALTVPILVDGALWGFIGFSEQDHVRDWDPFLEILLVVAGSIGAAIARQRLRAELEERVEERTADLAAVNQDLEAFTHSVSHDLRAPLRHAGAYARLIAESSADRLDDDARRHLDNLIGATERMTRMVSGLLEFSRLGRAAIAVQRVELEPLVQSLLDERASDLNGRDVTFDVGELPAVAADPTLLRQVVANLIDNAIKYTGGTDPSTIRIRAEATDTEVSLSVADDGVGFDMAYADQLFGVFRRLHAQSEFEGSGVGLAVVRRIVERHGGRCDASAARGQGATFTIALPSAAAAT